MGGRDLVEEQRAQELKFSWCSGLVTHTSSLLKQGAVISHVSLNSLTPPPLPHVQGVPY